MISDDSPELPSNARRERTAVAILVGHFAWYLIFIIGATISAIRFCGGDDGCYGGWFFI
jgi:hypothetical protein